MARKKHKLFGCSEKQKSSTREIKKGFTEVGFVIGPKDRNRFKK